MWPLSDEDAHDAWHARGERKAVDDRERERKTAQAGQWLLNQPEVYNHMYVLAMSAQDEFTARERLRSLWRILYALVGLLWPDITRVIGVGMLIVLALYMGLRGLTQSRRKRVEHLREEVGSSFNDEVVRAQLEKLDAKVPRLPSVIYDLLAQMPPVFTDEELEQRRKSVTSEQWKRAMEVKSAWQQDVYKDLRTKSKF